MDTMSTLFAGTVTNGSLELDDCGLALFLASSGDRCIDACEITDTLLVWLVTITENPYSLVTIVDVKDLPAIGQETLLNILSESNVGITIDGDVWRSSSGLECSKGDKTHGCRRKSMGILSQSA